MIPILSAAITTSLIYLISVFTKQKGRAQIYFIIFFLLAAVSFIFRGKAEASLDHSRYIFQGIVIESKDETKKPSKLEFYKNKIKYHKECARECYQRAQDSCCLMPTIDDQEKAKYCLKSGIAILGPGTPATKVFYAIMSLASDYAIDVMTEWQRIQGYLMRGQIHAEMMEFYEAVLKAEKDK